MDRKRKITAIIYCPILDPEQVRGMANAWYILMRDKKIQKRTVLQRIPKENLSSESMSNHGEKLDDGVQQYADDVGIEIMNAELSSNWEKRTDWKITKMTKIK